VVITAGADELRSLREAPEVRDDVARIERDGPPFLVAATAAARAHLDAVAAGTTWLVSRDGEPVATVRAARLRWDGTPDGAPAAGLTEAVARAGEAEADTLAVLDVRVAGRQRGRGIGRTVLTALPELTDASGCQRTLALLRTHAKAEHPLTPYVRYLAAVRADGLPFDPWLRTAWRACLRPVHAVDRSLVTAAPLERWSTWADRAFPTSGPELIPGAIKPAIVEFERGEGRYREPHLWAAPTSHIADPPAEDADWPASLAHVGLVPGDRAHREVKRRGR
jgi:GNAT superfamily N-acetyltransferase